MSDWGKVNGSPIVQYKAFGRKIGHVVKNEVGGKGGYVFLWKGFFEGNLVGSSEDEAEAKAMVEEAALRPACRRLLGKGL